MRTTLNIDDDLYRQVKASAALRGCSVTSVIEEALRAALLRRSVPADLPSLPTLPGRLLVEIDLADNSAVRDLEDELIGGYGLR
mgnify:CR=1 FL=1